MSVMRKVGQTVAEALIRRWRKGGSWDEFIEKLPAGISPQKAKGILLNMGEIHVCEKCEIILERTDPDVRKYEQDSLCGFCALEVYNEKELTRP